MLFNCWKVVGFCIIEFFVLLTWSQNIKANIWGAKITKKWCCFYTLKDLDIHILSKKSWKVLERKYAF